MGRPVRQWQIVTKNPEGLARFYQALFDWRIDADNAMGYRMAATGDGGIDGGFWPAPPEAPSFVQLFVQVDDVGATVDQAKALGGAVVIPPQTLPDGDQMAILRDPEGVTFGVMTRARA